MISTSVTLLVIGALCVGTAGLKASRPALLGTRQPSDRALAVIALVPAALLTGLVVYEAFSGDPDGVVVDARAVGLATAALGALARLRMTVIIVLAAGATALVRAVG